MLRAALSGAGQFVRHFAADGTHFDYGALPVPRFFDLHLTPATAGSLDLLRQGFEQDKACTFRAINDSSPPGSLRDTPVMKYWVEIDRADGEVFAIKSVCLGSGETAFLVSVIKPVRAAQQASLTAARLDAAEILTSGLTHDFNNILATTLGSVELIQLRADDADYVRKKAQMAQNSISRAIAIIRSLLSFSEPNSGTEAANSAEIIEDTVALMQSSVPANVELRHELTCDAMLNVDPTLFEAALINLIFNARDAIKGPGRIAVTSDRFKSGSGQDSAAPDFVVVTISDTGPGIPEELREKILTPFFSTKPHGRGVGLGLSVIDKFVQEAGGRLEVESKPGEGTHFRMILPIVSPDAVE